MKYKLLIFLLLGIQCSHTNSKRFCDTRDFDNFIEGLILFRQFTTSEFYCSSRIRNSSTNTTVTNTIQISYPNKLYSRFVGESFAITPTLSGTVNSCSISPSPPAGITISNDCTILGTSSFSGEGLEYTITARDLLGNSSKTSFKLKVLGTTAFRVYGTSGAFNTSAANACTGGLAVNGANCLSAPRGLVFDSNDNLYVADSGNHRVLFFQKGNTTATIVYGQNDFNSGGINRGGSTAQNSLRTPQGITFSPTGELYIADADNNRVVVYPKDSNSTANRVIGKTGSFTNNVSGTNIDSFSATGNITFDSQGNFYIADVTNHRVLYYPSGTFTPTKVYGQPNFITGTSGTTQITLSFPISVTVHPTRGDLYLMDQLNKRILFYGTSESTTPSSITFGQTIYTTSNTACNSTSFNAGPTDAAFDSNDALFFTDSGGGHRVLVMPFPYTSVTRVFGQTNLVTCNGTSSATGLNNPQWLEFDSFGNLYVSDTGNNRILVF